MAPPSCSQSLSHPSCAKFCAHPLVFSRRKNSWPMSTRFEGGKQDFSSLKGDAAGILSEFRHRGISTSGFFWRIDARDGYMSLQELSGLELVSHRIFRGFFGFSLSRNRNSITRMDSGCLEGNSLKDNDFKGRSDYVKDVTKNSNKCMHYACEKEQTP